MNPSARSFAAERQGFPIQMAAGTLDATLPATSGTGATGTITVHVTF